MIITGDLGAGPAPAGDDRIVAVDVEWSKNYRIKNGNRPFCYSIVDCTTGPAGVTWTYRSVYVEHPDETQDLIRAADADMAALLDAGVRLTGHQLSSDLAVLVNAATGPLPHVEGVRRLWRARATSPDRPLIDTRYDAAPLLEGTSRRLVDVCTEFGLDVTQPELRGTSMTALHRRWITTGDTNARERITVLNLRHSLSTALVALAAHHGRRPAGRVNVNRLLHHHLRGAYTWLATPTFADLL